MRNFSIIAHIDHGKSTLSDRIIELTNGLTKHEMTNQVLDNMDLERERGITIKLNAVQLNYKSKNNGNFIYHLIDTPGHIDFTYEVSRSLAACDGAILVVDATQGVEAQTLSNVYLALENNITIIPVINKIDLPNANVEKTIDDIKNRIGLDVSNICLISAKTGKNVDTLLERIHEIIPHPQGNNNSKLEALVFDSYYDKYRGVICYICVKNGTIKKNDKIIFMSSKKEFTITELGVKTPKELQYNELVAGEVGWIAANIKNAHDISVGDTITLKNNPAEHALPGYKNIKPMVFSSLFPIDNAKYDYLKEAMAKIYLSDSSLQYEYESSQALGFGVRCGFLGLLHMEIIKERLTREYLLDLIVTTPSVAYEVYLTNGTQEKIYSPSKMPDRTHIKEIHEPFVKLVISTPNEYIGDLIKLCERYRGKYIDMICEHNIYKLIYHIPLGEIIYDFFDNLKSISHGYATMDYDLIGYQKQDLIKVDILLNGKQIEAFSFICHRDSAYSRSSILVKKIKKHMPRQLFELPIQAAIGGKIIARETVSAIYKNVLAKCYGGDVTRKKKLLEQQKEGKKKLKMIGDVSIPGDIFIKILKDDD